MQIIAYLAANASWAWIIAGIVLLGLELMVPGGFLLWMGVAGVITGVLTLLQPIAWPVQWLIFGGLSLLAISAWIRWVRSRPSNTDRPYLNRRADRFIGHEAVLEQPIEGGFGRLALGDSVWRIAGPDLPAGRRVRIIDSDGAVLMVELIDEP